MKPFLVLFALAAPLAAVDANPSAADPQHSTGNATETAQPAQPGEARAQPSERRICRRIENTGSRTDVQRVCMTAAEWRRAGQ